MNTDRTIHATRADGCQIVRYDRAGKWYLEWPADSGIPRQAVGLTRAVDEALMADREKGGKVRLGLPGGGAFDALYRRTHRRHGADA